MRGKAQGESPVRAVGATWRIRLNNHDNFLMACSGFSKQNKRDEAALADT